MTMTADELNAKIEAELQAQIEAELQAEMARKRMEIAARLQQVHSVPAASETDNGEMPKSRPARRPVQTAAIQPAARASIRAQTKITGTFLLKHLAAYELCGS
jgi:hypothetical protein